MAPITPMDRHPLGVVRRHSKELAYRYTELGDALG